MSPSNIACKPPLKEITEVTRRYWGWDHLRPLQEEAIRAELEQRDSVVVLPTGGGKSLCYQVPPVMAKRTDIVVSPLISLMKDQVDALRAGGYPAAALHSGMSPVGRQEVERGLTRGQFALVFAAPERLLSPPFLQLIKRLQIRAFAIDEAHCISHWGHDFRPEYRRLAILKERFPQASVHAYTATATERVRADIAEQLKLRDPLSLVGVFDRPNLVYRVVPLVDLKSQVLEAVGRHNREATIVYCITRKDSESLASWLTAHGVRAAAYHAGMDSEQRRRTQDAFCEERVDVIVATVAFGMGIDRSNVRCVIHAAMPKSMEHYQQETGRAGRDGLAAECVMFHSPAAAVRWKSLITRSAEEAREPEQRINASLQLLEQMQRFCTRVECRHRALSEHFGQPYDQDNCGACDVCLDEVDGLIDATITAQKIISCVARVRERFGAKHVVDVLVGAETEQVRRCGHDQLSTYGLLKDTRRGAVTNMLYQLVDLGLLIRTEGDRPIVMLNDASWEVLRGERRVRLQQPKPKAVKRTLIDRVSWEGVHRGLFEHLRDVRRTLAAERGVPAFVIFGDVTLREMARFRPGSQRALHGVHGVGDKKLADFGEVFLSEIKAYCHEQDLETDAG